jgi:hypothetical protein
VGLHATFLKKLISKRSSLLREGDLTKGYDFSENFECDVVNRVSTEMYFRVKVPGRVGTRQYATYATRASWACATHLVRC